MTILIHGCLGSKTTTATPHVYGPALGRLLIDKGARFDDAPIRQSPEDVGLPADVDQGEWDQEGGHEDEWNADHQHHQDPEVKIGEHKRPEAGSPQLPFGRRRFDPRVSGGLGGGVETLALCGCIRGGVRSYRRERAVVAEVAGDPGQPVCVKLVPS
jgi:hypothetical protein